MILLTLFLLWSTVAITSETSQYSDSLIVVTDKNIASENYITAMDQLIKAAEQIETADSTDKRLGPIYMRLGVCYDYFDYSEYSKYYLQKAIAVFGASGDETGQGYCLTYLGDMYEDGGHNTEAFIYQKLALKKFQNTKDRKGMAVVYDNMSSIFENYKQYDSSLQYLVKAYDIYLQLGDSVGRCVVMNNFGDIYLKKGDKKMALEYYKRSLDLSRLSHNKEEERGNLKDLSKYYAQIGDYQKAYKYFETYYELHRKLKIEKKIEEISRMQVKALQDKKELEIRTVQSEKQVAILRDIIIMASLLVAIGVLLFIYFSYKSHAKKDRQLHALKEYSLQYELELRKQKLQDYTRLLTERNDMIESLKKELDKTFEKDQVKDSLRYKAIEQLSNAVILTDDDWKQFKKQFESVYNGFFVKLRESYSDLSTGDIRLAALLKLKLSQEEIAGMMGISVEGVKKARSRLKKKIALDEETKLKDWIEGI